MLRLMRKHAKAWFMQVVLGIIILVFIFYFGSMRGRKKAEAVAIVNNNAIGYMEFREEYQKLLDFYRQRYKGALTDVMLKSLNLKQRALDNVINQAVLLSKADEFKLGASDTEVRSAIASYPAFRKNGSFDINLYHRMLRYNKLSPEDFEATQKKIIKINKLEKLIKRGIKVSDKEAFDIYRLQNEKISLDFLKIPTQDFKVKIKPSDKDLEQYLKEHGEKFRIPRKVQVKYIAFLGKDFAKSIDVSEQDIEDYYYYNKSEFIKSGNEAYPLSEVKDRIRTKLRLAKGMAAASRKAKEANDIIYQEENFEEYVKENKLETTTTEPFSRYDLPKELAQIQNIKKYVFDMKEGETAPLLSDDKGFYIIKIKTIKPSYIPGLREAGNRIKREYLKAECKRMSKEKAGNILNLLKKGIGFEKVAREEKLKVVNTGLFLPSPDVPLIGSSMELGQALFLLSEKTPYPDKPFYINGNYVIVRFKERETLDLKDMETEKDNLINTLLRVKKEEQFRLWLETTKADMVKEGTLKITADLDRI